MKKNRIRLVFLLFIVFAVLHLQAQQININPILDKENHDIRLSPWGPYSKRYAGISHVADMQSGMRFDFTVCPGYYRNKVMVPNVMFESGYTPWEVSSDLKHITYRYQLEWKDQVYTDITYHTLDSFRVLVEMDCVNKTSLSQNITLNSLAFIDYPSPYPLYKASNAESMQWLSAIDYTQLNLVTKNHRYFLSEDGKKRNEVRNDSSLTGSLLANKFGIETNDEAQYQLSHLPNQGEGTLFVRYRVKKGAIANFQLSGIVNQTIDFVGSGDFELKKISCKFNANNLLNLRSTGNSAIDLDGFFISAIANAQVPTIIPQVKYPTPIITHENGTKKLVLQYKDIQQYYGLAWDYASDDVREVMNDELDVFFKLVSNNNVKNKFIGNEKGHFTNVFFRPVELAPNESKKIYLLICNGTEKQVNTALSTFNATNLAASIPVKPTGEKILPAGRSYKFGNQLLKAALLTNIVYPIYTQRQNIRHFTPGKWWNSLYTWDLGFVALGLQEVDLQKSYETINAYTTSVGNQSAFIQHGSPVPVQFFAFYELMNRTQSKELLQYMYPRLKQYYQFMVGETLGSTTHMSSNLLKPWDYFYNSGGWDDYPPQKYLRDNVLLRNTITPVITTAQCIRAAKIMRIAAKELGFANDITNFDSNIKNMSTALQENAWDDSTGYFSYVVHDNQGKAQKIFRYPTDGTNYNMGLDGVSPLVAGIATPSQQKKMLDNLFSSKHLWTPYGLTAVDQSATYFKQDGYWNGTVWMPHQWFMWKAMLDMGEGDKAFTIAYTALELWKRETEATQSTFEHFISSTGRGAGWSQFSGLSSPVLNWYASYYKVGRVTTGFEVWIQQQLFNAEFTKYNAQISFDESTPAHTRTLLICLDPANKYEAFFNQVKLKTSSDHAGFLQIDLPATNQSGTLTVSTINNPTNK
jgi:hypothetical protein